MILHRTGSPRRQPRHVVSGGRLTSYYFLYVAQLDPATVQEALAKTCAAAREHNLWVIAGTLRKTADSHLNIAHVINPQGQIIHEYAKAHTAGRDEKKYCRSWCTMRARPSEPNSPHEKNPARCQFAPHRRGHPCPGFRRQR